MKLIYKPFGLVLSLLAGFLAKKLFDVIWGLFDKEEPPEPKTLRASWPKVLAAAVVEGATFRATRAAVDRAGAKSFHRLTGIWPGEKEPDEAEVARAVR
jgi:uncharacterized protein DUF4235